MKSIGLGTEQGYFEGEVVAVKQLQSLLLVYILWARQKYDTMINTSHG